MRDTGLGQLIPLKWLAEAPPFAIVEIYVDWLLHEIDREAEQRWPILKTIKGWRRAEVIAFLENMPDWTTHVLD